MSTTPIPSDRTAYIRTYVPLGVGAILGWAIVQFTIVRDAIAWLDTNFATYVPGTNWRELLDAAAIAAVTALYYWGARQIGKKYPNVEKWLLGSSAVPTYTAR